MTLTSADLSLFEPLAWRLARLQNGLAAGRHPALWRGAGEVFADVAEFLQHPDARRLDIRRTLTDPFGNLQVRRFQQRVRTEVHILLDASASLAAQAASDRQGLAALIAAGMARATVAGGDPAVLHIGAGERLLHSGPRLRNPAASLGCEALVRQLQPAGQGLSGLVQASGALPRHGVFVILISDFDTSPAELADLLQHLRPRPVLPVWLRDSGLEDPGEGFGLMELRDPETGRTRLVLRTTRRAARLRDALTARRQDLRHIFAQQGLTPLEVCDSLDPQALRDVLEVAFA